MPSCERAPSGHIGLIPAWLVACMKNLKKISTHILTVLTNKCYSTARTKEEEQKGIQKSSGNSESGFPETNIRDYIEGADKAA